MLAASDDFCSLLLSTITCMDHQHQVLHAWTIQDPYGTGYGYVGGGRGSCARPPAGSQHGNDRNTPEQASTSARRREWHVAVADLRYYTVHVRNMYCMKEQTVRLDWMRAVKQGPVAARSRCMRCMPRQAFRRRGIKLARQRAQTRGF